MMFEFEEWLLQDVDDSPNRRDGNHEYFKHKPNRKCSARWKIILLFIATLFAILFAIFFIIYPALYSNPTTRNTELLLPLETVSQEDIPADTPHRDLKFTLHPEEHVSRDAGTRRFSWNITKETISPDGVQKRVFLINSEFDCFIQNLKLLI